MAEPEIGKTVATHSVGAQTQSVAVRRAEPHTRALALAPHGAAVRRPPPAARCIKKNVPGIPDGASQEVHDTSKAWARLRALERSSCLVLADAHELVEVKHAVAIVVDLADETVDVARGHVDAEGHAERAPGRGGGGRRSGLQGAVAAGAVAVGAMVAVDEASV